MARYYRQPPVRAGLCGQFTHVRQHAAVVAAATAARSRRGRRAGGMPRMFRCRRRDLPSRRSLNMPGTERVEITGPNGDRFDEILTPQAIDLIAALHTELGARRQELLAARRRRQAEFSRGAMLDFLPETQHL